MTVAFGFLLGPMPGASDLLWKVGRTFEVRSVKCFFQDRLIRIT